MRGGSGLRVHTLPGMDGVKPSLPPLIIRLRPYTLRPWFAGCGCSTKARDHAALTWVQDMCDWDVGCPALGIYKKPGPRKLPRAVAINAPKELW
jgi:hypothetical protein